MLDLRQEVEEPARLPDRRPRQWFLITAALLATAAVVISGLVVGPMLKSPQQAAAEALPPQARSVLVSAEKRALTERIVFRAAIVPGKSLPLTATAALVSKVPVVTGTPLGAGSAISDGVVLLEANGEPVFAMNWPFRPYRDLEYGFYGPDVAALQNTLATLGYATSLNSLLDSRTAAGLTQFYKDRGYEVLTKSEAIQKPEAVTMPLLKTPTTGTIDTEIAHPYLPASHVLRIPARNHVITAVGTQVGSDISDPAAPLFNLDGERGSGLAAVTAEQATKLAPGNKAEFRDSRDGSTHAVTVKSIATSAGDVPGVGQGFRVEFSFDGTVPAPTPDGTTLMVAAQVGNDLGDVLAAPVTAVYSDADGSSYITVSKNGSITSMPVATGKSLGGWIQILPEPGHDVAPGDQLVVGDLVETSVAP